MTLGQRVEVVPESARQRWSLLPDGKESTVSQMQRNRSRGIGNRSTEVDREQAGHVARADQVHARNLPCRRRRWAGRARFSIQIQAGPLRARSLKVLGQRRHADTSARSSQVRAEGGSQSVAFSGQFLDLRHSGDEQALALLAGIG